MTSAVPTKPHPNTVKAKTARRQDRLRYWREECPLCSSKDTDQLLRVLWLMRGQYLYGGYERAVADLLDAYPIPDSEARLPLTAAVVHAHWDAHSAAFQPKPTNRQVAGILEAVKLTSAQRQIVELLGAFHGLEAEDIARVTAAKNCSRESALAQTRRDLRYLSAYHFAYRRLSSTSHGGRSVYYRGISAATLNAEVTGIRDSNYEVRVDGVADIIQDHDLACNRSLLALWQRQRQTPVLALGDGRQVSVTLPLASLHTNGLRMAKVVPAHRLPHAVIGETSKGSIEPDGLFALALRWPPAGPSDARATEQLDTLVPCFYEWDSGYKNTDEVTTQLVNYLWLARGTALTRRVPALAAVTSFRTPVLFVTAGPTLYRPFDPQERFGRLRIWNLHRRVRDVLGELRTQQRDGQPLTAGLPSILLTTAAELADRGLEARCLNIKQAPDNGYTTVLNELLAAATPLVTSQAIPVGTSLFLDPDGGQAWKRTSDWNGGHSEDHEQQEEF